MRGGDVDVLHEERVDAAVLVAIRVWPVAVVRAGLPLRERVGVAELRLDLEQGREVRVIALRLGLGDHRHGDQLGQ